MSEQSSEKVQQRIRRFARRRQRRTVPRVRRMKIHLKVAGIDYRILEEYTQSLAAILRNRGAKVSGPIKLPTKKLYLSVRKSPCGEGTPTYDFFELSIHKRLIVAELTSRDLTYILTVPVPKNTWTEIRLQPK
ncbi:MAG: 30S ribosomal protein S10 [Candidatus Njordarchaeales archaeon]